MHTFINPVFLKKIMEKYTKLIFKGRIDEFDTWFKAMMKKYPNATLDVVLRDWGIEE